MAGKSKRTYCLRPMAMDDVPAISRWFEEMRDLCLFDRTCAVPTNEANTSAVWERLIGTAEPGKHYWFAAEDHKGKVVGIAGISDVNYIHGDGVIALYMLKEYRRKGIGLRMMAMITDIAFQQLRLNRITSYYREDNAASAELLAKLGFSKEGLIRKAWYSEGKHFDTIALGLLGSEWAEAGKKLKKVTNGKIEIVFGRQSQIEKS